MFKRWCTEQNLNNATNLSHVLMDGGVLSVPFDTLDTFHEKYIEAVKNGERLYVVEQKTERYNFFVDIDYKAPEALELREIKDICKIICDKVRRHGGKECLVSVAPPKKCPGGLVKTGVHLNWHGFVVDQASAVALREHIILTLATTKSGDWDSIIDAAVYGNASRKTKGSGFRMPWSYKRVKHDECEGRGCDACESGKVDQLAYLPLFVYRCGVFNQMLDVSQDPSLDVLKMAVVRTNEPQTIHVDPPVKAQQPDTLPPTTTDKDEVCEFGVKRDLEQFIREHMEGQGSARVTKLFKKRDTYLVSTTSRYCENIKREHGSNHVWFIVSGHTILQKCFCICDTLVGRRDGFCKDFCGRRHKLSNSIVDQLYPNKEELSKCPEIKKWEEKPQVNNDAKEHLERFIKKFMQGPETMKAVSLKQQKTNTILLTTSTHCETIHGDHGDGCVMSYIIKGKEIRQKCPRCKKSTSRTHCLTPNVINILKHK